jgi:hypothetical protein
MTVEEERAGSGKLAGVGGKGGGGRWLFVSHDPVRIGAMEGGIACFLGMKEPCGIGAETGVFAQERLIHFKFEPMASYNFVFWSVLIYPYTKSDGMSRSYTSSLHP